MERYERLRTCTDVFDLKYGVGESLTLDYKEKLSGQSRDLAADVCALANTQGGVLVVGVKDPKPEGSPPKDPEDFKGVPVEDDLVHRVESQLIDAVSPRVFPRVKTTKDTFEREGRERCFLLIGVEASSHLHQVTVERDFKFYRRAQYQNRPMTTDEVALRMESILAGRRGTDVLFEEEIVRLERVVHGPYVALLAVPVLEHRLAADPGEPEVRREIARLAQTHRHRAVPLVLNSVEFVPTGDGTRGTLQYHTSGVATECRIRSNSFITHAQTGEAIGELSSSLLMSRENPASNLWREHSKQHHLEVYFQSQQSMEPNRPSTIIDPAAAVLVKPEVLREKVEGFLSLVRGVYDLGGWRGAIRLKAVVHGRQAFPAVRTKQHVIDFWALSETLMLQTDIEFHYDSIELRRGELAEELMRRLARNFGMDRFPS